MSTTGRATPPGSIPVELTGRCQWVCWRSESRGGRATKVPYRADGCVKASSTDSSTWAEYEEVCVSAADPSKALSGIGYVFSADDPYFGIDLDNCIVDGVIKPWAAAIIDRFNTYAEISPSGNGVKLWGKGHIPGPRNRTAKPYKIEMYDVDRFFTVTGLSVGSAAIRECQAELNALYTDVFGSTKPKATASSAQSSTNAITDDELVRRASDAKNGAKFKALWRGDITGYASNSEADLAMCSMIAFYTGPDPERIESIARASGLKRDKWDRDDYLPRTIATALAGRTEFFKPRARSKKTPAQSHAGPTDSGRAASNTTLEPDGKIALGQRDPDSGRLVLSPRRTVPTVEAFVKEFYTHADGRTLYAYAGQLMEWRGNRYTVIEDAFLKHRLQPWLHQSLRYIRSGKVWDLGPFESNPSTVSAALESMRSHVHIPSETPVPCWLDGRSHPPTREILSCATKNLHVPTGLVLPPTPKLFATSALEFDYESDPEPPEQWIRFLDVLWGDDLESVQLLQEWFGYCLIPDTSLQKAMLLVGPRRSGKGTIARVMTKLVGSDNVVGPTTSSLAGMFGMQPLIGKSVAIVSDARFHGENVPIAIERMLAITGEDLMTIDCKFEKAFSIKLPTRFMIISNELPRLTDASSALPGRFVVLKLTKSFYGKEDPALTDRLLKELPGILKWAIDGLKRLHARGRFVQPASVAEAVQEMEEMGSPVLAFVRECCRIGPGLRVPVDDLFECWKQWCGREGRDAVGTKQTFGKNLGSAVPGVIRRRGTHDTFYEGIDRGETYP